MVVAVGWVICEVIQIVADEVIAGDDLMFPSGIAKILYPSAGCGT